MKERLHELERKVNAFGMVVTSHDISRGEEMRRRLFQRGVAWFGILDGTKFGFYVAPNEKPFVIKPTKIYEDVEDLILEDGKQRFRFMFVTEDDERRLLRDAKEEAEISSIRAELERVLE
jgi:hypothetical protein